MTKRFASVCLVGVVAVCGGVYCPVFCGNEGYCASCGKLKKLLGKQIILTRNCALSAGVKGYTIVRCRY